MQTRNIFILLFLFFGLGSMGCEEIIDIKLDESNSWMTIEGWVTTDPGPYQIKIHETIPIYSTNELTPAENGVVTITDDQGGVDLLTEVEPGIYETNSTVGVIGHRYSLRVEFAGEVYEASETMPRVNPIDTLVSFHQDAIGFLEEGYYVAFVAQEPPGGPDYYRFFFSVNDSLYDGLGDLFFTDDAFSDGQLAIFQFPYKVDTSDKVEVVIQSLPTTCYDYYTTLQSLLYGGGSPFGAPPDNVKGNITNGALGYFGAGARAYKSTVVSP
ncbi:MAG: DUF4249 domain-containing protein [Bacteroidia bacterium]|nr:DUF4249 domain-containing protein [Bacteroidia bacterium]